MHIPKLAILGSVVLGLIATFTVATTSQAHRGAPITPSVERSISASIETLAGADAPTIVTQVLSRASDEVSIRFTTDGVETTTLAFEPPGPATIECGSSLPVASPDNGVAGQGTGATANDALGAAFADLLSKLAAYSRAKCQACPIPGQCQLYGSFLTECFSLVSLTQGADGTWHAVLNYTGPYFMLCTDCLPSDGE